MGVGGQGRALPGLPAGKRPGTSGRVQKISPTPGFDPWTVKPVVSRYTDWASPAHHVGSYVKLISVS
jgi:hypothetical protein